MRTCPNSVETCLNQITYMCDIHQIGQDRNYPREAFDLETLTEAAEVFTTTPVHLHLYFE
ncbi:hypothetical protein RUM43_003251 [Polyplax serrata]|uniref:Uncharacterized protein n=1 Tax=Polyplax serrata TaxID=468196 RepID=A0AAN8NZU7_POLSC